MASCLCCLCRESVTKDHRRRKRLHGPSCALVFEKLQELAGLSNFTTIRDTDAFLCMNCEKIIIDLTKLQKKVSGSEQESSPHIQVS